MKILMKSTQKWSINYVATNLNEGETYEVPDAIGNKIIELGYGEDPKTVGNNKESSPEKKQQVVTENKAITATEENKSVPSAEEDKKEREPKKRGPKPKK